MNKNIIILMSLSIFFAREINVNLGDCKDVKVGVKIYIDNKNIGKVVSLDENCNVGLDIKTGYDDVTGSTVFKVDKNFSTVFLIADMEETKKAEEERLAAEEVAKAEEERLAAEAVAKAEEERLAAEAAAKAEEERLAAEAQAKIGADAAAQKKVDAEAAARAKIDADAAAAQAKIDANAAEAQAKIGADAAAQKKVDADEAAVDSQSSDPDSSGYDVAPKLKKNIFGNSTLKPKYPKSAKDQGIVGIVVIAFHIDKKGKISNVTVKDSSGDASLDDAAVSALKKSKWKAAKKDGEKVGADFTLPVRFELN